MTNYYKNEGRYMTNNIMKKTVPEKIFTISNYMIMALFMLACLYPFYYVLIYSLSSQKDILKGVFLFPSHIDLTSYKNIFEKGDIQWGFLVSIARTVLSTILCVFCSSLVSYLVTKNEMLFRKFVYRFIIITMYLNAGLIPWYITMKTYGFRNNFLLYIIPGAVNAFYIVLVKTYIEQLPQSLEESASIDGAGIFTIFLKLILPLSKPIIATIAIYAAVGSWNSWIDNFFLVSDKRLTTLQLVLYNYINQAQVIADSMKYSVNAGSSRNVSNITPEGIRMATTVITVVPIVLVYPFLQKYFVKGIMMGAIKG